MVVLLIFIPKVDHSWFRRKRRFLTWIKSICHRLVIIDRLTEAGYLHYEISNFARPGFFSKHNSSYWTGKKYLGLGPSAHSYNGIDREWNPSSLPIYIEGIENGHPTIESEDLDLCTRYNDFIITGLRTMWGVSFADIQTKFGRKLLSYCQKQAQPHINQGLLLQTGDKLILYPK